MGRRKKESEEVHRANIFAAAKRLFLQNGIETTTVDEIAREAGYSKATVYVYFRNKEEIIDVLVLESMKLLRDSIHEALVTHTGAKSRYLGICRALRRCQEEQPLYFELAVGEIRVDLENPDCLPVERDIWEAGEEINAEMAGFLKEGIESGEIRSYISILETVFLFWASLSGVIRMAERKKQYLETSMSISKQQFLDHGFETLWRCIGVEADG